MLSQIAIFILFLSPLVFFHELGHFLMARFWGVRVETFSIGFGPKLFKFKKGFTEYAFSLIPLGGYVKMFGDDPMAKNEIKEEDRKYSFIHQLKWPKFCIVSAGPIANFIMTFVLFFTLLMSGEKLPEIRIGEVKKDTTIYKIGIRTGDVLIKVNDTIISDPTDIVPLEKEILKNISVRRGKEEITVAIEMNSKEFFDELVKYFKPLVSPLLVDKQGKYFGISLQDGTIDWKTSLSEILGADISQKVYFYKLSDDFAQIIKEKKSTFEKFQEFDLSGIDNWQAIRKAGFFPADLLVKKVKENSAAEKAKIVAGDIIVELERTELNSFDELRSNLQKTTTESVTVGLFRNGELIRVDVTPELIKQDGKSVKLIGIESAVSYVESGIIQTHSKGLINSLTGSFSMTIDVIGKTIVFLRDLISGNISLKNVGGPIAISDVASNSFNFSISYFFRIMAIMSANLGLINLLPVPVLDGGHLMFIFIEFIKRSPISRRKLEIAQQFGLSLLLLLMIVVFYNDLSRINIFEKLFN